MKHGDLCRARCTAPARYLAAGKCMFVSAMCNELALAAAVPATGGEERFPLPSDEEMAGALAVMVHLYPGCQR
jgi:hypothetical protein